MKVVRVKQNINAVGLYDQNNELKMLKCSSDLRGRAAMDDPVSVFSPLRVTPLTNRLSCDSLPIKMLIRVTLSRIGQIMIAVDLRHRYLAR